MRGIGWMPLVAAMVLFAAIASGPTTADPGVPQLEPSASSIDFAVGTTTNHFTWSTTLMGDFAVRLVFDLPFTQTCTFVVKAAGAVGASATQTYFGHDEPGRTWTALQLPHPLSTHVSGLAVVLGAPTGGLWAATHTHVVTLQGEETWMYAGFGLRGWANPITSGKSLIFDLACPNAFTIAAIDGGKQALSFTPTWMRGGVGVTTGAPLVTAVNIADSAARTFTEPDVRLRFRAADTIAGGALLVQRPGTDDERLLLGDDDVLIDGPSGPWGVTFTRASAGTQQAVGLVTGMRPVPSLDAAAAL